MARLPTRHVQSVHEPSPAADAASLLAAGLDVAYQPIVQLGTGSVIAYEALARPRHEAARNPLVFFDELARAGLRLEAERTSLQAAMKGTGEGWATHRRTRLFLNVSPNALCDPEFDVLELVDMADRNGLAPSDVVVEVTESEAVGDLPGLERRSRRLRRLGIGLAVDDAGAGHASFAVITRLRPSYIKIDRDLVSGVDSDGARYAFVDAMVRFARQIGSRLVAEGIETEGELASLAGLGVDAGQGYYLARPEIGALGVPSPASRRMIAAAAQRLRLGAAQVSAGELAKPATIVTGDTSLAEAYGRFLSDPTLSLLVITEAASGADRVVAQLSRRTMERIVANPASWERVAERPVREVADHQGLSVLAQLDLTEVGAVLGARPPHEAGDDAVVTDARGEPVGVLEIRDVLRTLALVRRHSEGDLNPLSGLAGPTWIEAELGRRLDAGDAVTVLFVDLDAFHRLNDVGGFRLGDRVIRWLAQSLTGAAAGVQGARVGHVGGDDFLLLVPPRGYEELVAELVRSVESDVVPLVRTELRQWDAPELGDDIALSMASVILQGVPPPGHRYLEWAQSDLAPLLQTAKGHGSHSCVQHHGEVTTLSTWTPRCSGRRTVSLGLAEPGVVIRALDLIDESWARWWQLHGTYPEGGHTATVEAVPLGRELSFPGPRPVVQRLHDRYARPLRAEALAALEAGQTAMEVRLSGDEAELLELLDRIALVTQQAHTARGLPIPPEVALLDRLLRQRARVLTRQDRVTRTQFR
jgi:EAL domain-containing protein (putative c-di-GMP-specific phosphodiesterase class I)/GGDEF domain-containing protein